MNGANPAKPAAPNKHLDRAHALLARLDGRAALEGLFGSIQVQIDYKDGVPSRVRHYIEGVELTQEIEDRPKTAPTPTGA